MESCHRNLAAQETSDDKQGETQLTIQPASSTFMGRFNTAASSGVLRFTFFGYAAVCPARDNDKYDNPPSWHQQHGTAWQQATNFLRLSHNHRGNEELYPRLVRYGRAGTIRYSYPAISLALCVRVSTYE